MTDSAKLSDFVIGVRRILDQCERATEQPVPWSTIQGMREKCREVGMIADRLQRSEDDGK
jgi:hypothetical protein